MLPYLWPCADIVSASKTSETLCENSMKIFKLLSEEVFDFARLDLTQVLWQLPISDGLTGNGESKGYRQDRR
jgi:hypothetical protein